MQSWRIVVLVLVLSSISLPVLAADWQRIEAINSYLTNQQPQQGGVNIGLPLVAEDGSAVPLKITFSGELADDEYIDTIRVFASNNPNTEVIDFELSAAIPRTELSTRIRLRESQTLFVVAKSNLDNYWIASRDIRVTVSGCLMAGDVETTATGMSQPRVALPRSATPGEAAEIRTMINHPMETGFRDDGQGGTLAENLVESLEVSQAGEVLLTVGFHTGTSANPFVGFYLDQFSDLSFTWTDQQAERITETR
ncbi:thiosulfate oxidation carrier protein SoxY [Nitrincola sp.]|uniref:thiosulfate oxidation carrier protein SoxY n=1 Tax=Nitrincola sp. TaxID=1926584 RepID=UPI003A8F0B39